MNLKINDLIFPPRTHINGCKDSSLLNVSVNYFKRVNCLYIWFTWTNWELKFTFVFYFRLDFKRSIVGKGF